MNKSEILEVVIIELLSEIKSAEDNFETYKKLSLEAPSAMESHSDTSRFQFGRLASDAGVYLDGIRRMIKMIQEYKENVLDRISSGAVVQTEENGKIVYFLVVPENMVMKKIKDGDKIIQIISEKSPIGQVLMNKKTGNEISFRLADKDRKIKILNVV